MEIRLNTSPTIKDLEELNPYAVFLATGAESIVPNIPGINKENVYTVIDVLEEKD